MAEQFLDRLRASFHGLLSEDIRNEMYMRAPGFVQSFWDRFGEDPEIPENESLTAVITENDVLFSIRFFWFHEPSAELVEHWYTYATRFHFERSALLHELRHTSDALAYERESENSVVPADAAYVTYAYRLLLRREPTKAELALWLERLQETNWSLAEFVASFENSDEYQERRKLETEPHLVELDPFKIYVRLSDYVISAPIARNGDYENHIRPLIGKIVRPGDYAIDVGANVGYHALRMASIVGDEGKVFAFEPLPSNCELIELSIAANDFANLQLFPYAAGAAEGEIELLVEGDHTNARLITDMKNDIPKAKRHLVRVVKVDDLLGDIPRLRFVKIDAEGAEPMIVAGMSELITRHRPILLFEFFPDFIRMVSQSEPQQYLDQIIDLGYRLYIIGEPPLLTKISDSAEGMRVFEEGEHFMMDFLALPLELEDFPGT